jgi:hypothetical protein
MFYDTARSFKHVQTTVICVDVLVSALWEFSWHLRLYICNMSVILKLKIYVCI